VKTRFQSLPFKCEPAALHRGRRHRLRRESGGRLRPRPQRETGRRRDAGGGASRHWGENHGHVDAALGGALHVEFV
jgi:hypothetical protein